MQKFLETLCWQHRLTVSGRFLRGRPAGSEAGVSCHLKRLSHVQKRLDTDGPPGQFIMGDIRTVRFLAGECKLWNA